MANNKENNSTEEPIEKQLWKAADKLRKNIDAAEYKHVVLGLIFLRYISDVFEELYLKLKAGEGEYEGADPEDKDEYKAENVFFVPEIARWSFLQSKAKLPTIGKEIDNAMDAIEKDNPSLKDVLPKVFARGNLDPTNLGGLIDLMGNIALGDAKSRSADVLGHVFEYFITEEHWPADAGLEEANATQDERSHDALSEVRLRDEDVAQPVRRNDDRLDRLRGARVHQRRAARQLRELAHERAGRMGDDGLAVSQHVVLAHRDLATQDDEHSGADLAARHQTLIRVVGPCLAEGSQPIDLGRRQARKHLVESGLDGR